MVSSTLRGFRLTSLLHLSVGILLTIVWTTSAAIAGSFFPFEEIEPGQWGVARTVIQGTTVETFSVEVLGVLEDAGPNGDLIMVKVAGDVVERTGGIAAGMSGTPVYIDGKLFGAIAYAFAADPTIGLVTPIDDMLALMELGQTPPQGASRGQHALAIDEKGLAKPVESPLMVSGLGQRAFELLSNELRPYNLVPMRAAGMASSAAAGHVEPGSAMAVQLVRGDINISHLGTLTYMDDEQFVAFGHSLLNFGQVDFFASQAYIHRTIGRLGSATKLGAPLDPIGRVSQDRGAGLAGQFGEAPQGVRLVVQVADRDLGRQTTFEAEMVNNEALLLELTATAALEAIDRGIDRLGPGWARVNVRLDGAGLPRPIQRENMFYSSADVAAEALGEFLWGLQEFTGNEFRAIDFETIEIQVEIGEQRRTARIISAVPEKTVAAQGEQIAVEVTIRPYRGEPQTETVYLPVPDDVSPGEVIVVIRPGMFPYLLAQEMAGSGDSIEPPADDIDSEHIAAMDDLDQMIDSFVNEERNDEIVLEYFPPLPQHANEEAADGYNGDFADSAGYDWDVWPDAVVTSLRTDYVIEGNATFSLNIVPAEVETETESEKAFPDAKWWRNGRSREL